MGSETGTSPEDDGPSATEGARDGCRLLVVAASSRDPDLASFVGAVHLGEAFVLWREGEPPLLGYLTPMERLEAEATGCRLLDPEGLRVRRLLESGGSAAERLALLLSRALHLAGWQPGTVELAGRYPAGDLVEAAERLAGEGWRFRSGVDRMRLRRKRKGAAELAEAGRAAAGAAAAMRRVAELLAAAEPGPEGLGLGGEPFTAGRLRRAIAIELAERGLDQPEGNIVAAGADAAVPHTHGADERVLRPGEPVVVDLFPRGRLFADCTRTFCVGKPPPALTAAHAAVRSALERAYREARPGRSAYELQMATCDVLEAAGYETPRSRPGTAEGYVHNLGHGVGYELHELPSFRSAAGEGGRLQEGDLFTLEPGLYRPGEGWGLRLEDLCRMDADGPVNLTPLPYDLDPRRW